MNKKLIGLLILLSIVYLFGVFFSGVYIHELVHKFEYRNIPKENESICVSVLMNCEGHFGFYYPEYDPKSQEEVKHTELYPSIITIIYFIVCIVLFVWFWEVQ